MMKRLLALLLAFVPGFMKAAPGKLGTDGDPIRQMLFACQSMKELLSQVHLNGNPGPFQTIADASKLVDEGRRGESMALLRSVLQTPALETRVQLWVWSCLRELGQNPDPKSGHEVLGVVLEMPSAGAYDTLAAYVDGTARYLNFSGAAIFWDAPDPSIKNLCQRFVDSTIPASSRASPRLSLALPKSGTQVTLLTRSGIYVIVGPPDPVISAGGGLMLEMMRRAKKNKTANQLSGPTSPSVTPPAGAGDAPPVAADH
jgi:hypothetical protein